MSATNTKAAVSQAYIRAIEAIAPLLLAAGISSKEAEQLTRHGLVRGAARVEKSAAADTPRKSNIGMKLGLHRNEVTKYLDAKFPPAVAQTVPSLHIDRILYEWHYDPDYLSGGEPKLLELDNPDPAQKTFTTLVRTYAANLYPPTLLKELQRVNAVERLPQGCLRVMARSYEPSSLSEEGVQEIGDRLRDFISSLVHNLLNTDQRRVCRTVQTMEIGQTSLPTVRQALQQVSSAFADQVYQLLTNRKWRRKPHENPVLITWNCHSAEQVLSEEARSVEPERDGQDGT